MITICWAAKGGSGTTSTTALLALAAHPPVTLVDLAGDLPAVLGGNASEPPGSGQPGVSEWMASGAPSDRLATIAGSAGPELRLVRCGRAGLPANDDERWADLGAAIAEFVGPSGAGWVDAGTGAPPAPLTSIADRCWLVTRPCYLAINRAAQLIADGARVDGVVLIDEPGRRLRRSDIEHAVGAPVVAEILHDPALARAVDAGLLVSRLPRGARRSLGIAA